MVLGHPETTAAEVTEHFSNLYYSLIPHTFGRSRPPVIYNPGILEKEIEYLESLSDIKAASEVVEFWNKALGSRGIRHVVVWLLSGLSCSSLTSDCCITVARGIQDKA